MSPRTKQQFEEIREVRRDLIRAKALKLFARQGFHTTSISMIAREAGISKGLIYNYYDSKEALLKDIIMDGMHKIMAMVDPDRNGVLTGEELLSMFRLTQDIMVRERRFWTLYFSILPQPSVLEIVKEEVMEIYNNLIGMFTEYFRRQGFIDPETEALMLGSMLDGIAFHYIFNPGSYPLEKVLARLTELYNLNKQEQ